MTEQHDPSIGELVADAYQLVGAITMEHPTLIKDAEKWLDNLAEQKIIHDIEVPYLNEGEIPEVWPIDTTAIEENRWNEDVFGFLKLVRDNPDAWHFDFDIKYLDIRIDTRDGGFLLFDRDRNRISPQKVLDAIKKVHARKARD